MELNRIIEGVSFHNIKGHVSIEISDLSFDSRKIEKGTMFFCIEGFNVDGHKFIKDAIAKGVSTIVYSKEIEESLIDESVTYIKTEDTRKAMAICARNFYGNSQNKLKIIGITGTNGKTTTSFMIKHILESAGYKVGIIGTIANYICGRKIETNKTTPEAIMLHELFREMVREEVDYCIMEVSSHSLALSRVYGIEFTEAVFTNLTQDHLDFHKTFKDYYETKLMLFKNSKTSIINMEDEYGIRIYNEVKNKKITYGLNKESQVYAEDIKSSSKKIQFTLCGKERNEINLNMPGYFNLYNALASASVCINEGIKEDIIANALNKIIGVPGRCELISKNYNLEFDIILDYAHTPDALTKIISTVKDFTVGRVICVFGCGGDRDRSKRSEMGKIATEASDYVIITSDNPRSENPEEIIQHILKGIDKDNYIVVQDRKRAIKEAIDMAKEKDTILIAGKGHEDYQETNLGRIPFDEKKIVDEIIRGDIR